MLQIVICDDKRSTTEDLENLLSSYNKENHLNMNITYFSSPSVLYAHMEQASVDIIFMDLDFGVESEDGILWSTKIHQDFPHTLILILTAYENRYKEGFVARAFRFMGKPISAKELYANMNACLEELNWHQIITVASHGYISKISTKDILYFTAHKGGSEVRTSQATHSCNKSLIHWEQLTPTNIFFRCHNKYLVNLCAIKQIKNHTILLYNGEKIPVSRQKWNLLKSTFMKFDISMKGRETNTTSS